MTHVRSLHGGAVTVDSKKASVQLAITSGGLLRPASLELELELKLVEPEPQLVELQLVELELETEVVRQPGHRNQPLQQQLQLLADNKYQQRRKMQTAQAEGKGQLWRFKNAFSTLFRAAVTTKATAI